MPPSPKLGNNSGAVTYARDGLRPETRILVSFRVADAHERCRNRT
jgi:hypothetical protein